MTFAVALAQRRRNGYRTQMKKKNSVTNTNPMLTKDVYKFIALLIFSIIAIFQNSEKIFSIISFE